MFELAQDGRFPQSVVQVHASGALDLFGNPNFSSCQEAHFPSFAEGSLRKTVIMEQDLVVSFECDQSILLDFVSINITNTHLAKKLESFVLL